VQEDASSHLLYEGGHSWVHLITTVSAPNQGTLLANGISTIGDTVVTLLASVFGVVGIAGDESTLLYDARMD
jgi:hypothetical protein